MERGVREHLTRQAEAPLGLHDLADPIAPIAADAPGEAAVVRFHGDRSLIALPILNGDAPAGLLDRQRIMETFADRHGWDHNARRPVAELMDPDPLIVDLGTPLAVLGRTLTRDRPTALQHGFILADRGRYVGVGTVERVMSRFVHDLEKRQRQANEANRAKSYFLANMSHELRTPLNAIIGFSEILKLRALGEGPDADARYAGYVSDIHESGSYLLELISDLLEISRVEAGVRNLDIEPQSTREALDRACRLLIPMADPRGVRLSCALETDRTVLADSRALQQVLMNFGTNAIKFSPPQGRVLMRAGASADGCWIEFSVLDEGPGFKATEKPASALIADEKGAGLGLNLCRALAEEMGGEIQTGDRETVGAWARLRLPAGASEALNRAG